MQRPFPYTAFFGLIFITLLGRVSPAKTPPSPAVGSPDRYNVVWDSPSDNASGSMPIGNGDIGLNVWVEKSGDLLFYIGKTDSCDENSSLLKLGRIRVRLTPSLLEKGAAFRQELHLENGEIVIATGEGKSAKTVRVWVDANHPEIHVEASGAEAFGMEASVELWRTEPRTVDQKSPEMSGYHELKQDHEHKQDPEPIVIEKDTILPAQGNSLCWYHRNERSIYPDVLRVQHLESLKDKYADPLLHRTFGCSMRGGGMVATDDHTLKSGGPALSQHLTITALTAITPTLDDWRKKLDALSAADDALDLEAARAAHAKWWREFWDRSWIQITGSKQAELVSSGYALQRWVEACGGRGALPMKFNGSIFTVGKSFPGPDGKEIEVPDWRAWGSNYWFQNQRHLYWPLLASGDYDLMEPWFKMYMNALPLATDKTAHYYNQNGACFQETIYFWGLASNADFGWTNKGNEPDNPYVRWYWSGGIELTAMMLDRYDDTKDPKFASETLLPFATAITQFYNEHWKRDDTGKIRFEPAQSLETWQSVTNPLPDIAGLHYVLPRLLNLGPTMITEEQRKLWTRLESDLPPIPIAPGPDGKPALQPADVFSKKSNSENTELYAIYPYRLYTMWGPGYETALRSYAARRFKGPTCWSQDPIDAALLGLTDDAEKDVIANFSATGARFQAFWRPGHDWIPDLDNGGAGMQALQWMLIQNDGGLIRLLPAWPDAWDVDFKLHAADQTIVEGKIRGGRTVEVKTTPEWRKANIIYTHPKPGEPRYVVPVKGR